MAQDNVLSDLLDLVGRDGATLEEEGVQEILKAGVPHALKAHLDLMLGGASERARMWVADRWLDRAGHSVIQKQAIKHQISLDPATLAALKQIALEDSSPVIIEANGHGRDPAAITGEVQSFPVLLGEGGPGLQGSKPALSPEAVLRNPVNDAQTKAPDGAAGTSQDVHCDTGVSDLAPYPEARSAAVLGA
jgi:hypothetical protein